MLYPNPGERRSDKILLAMPLTKRENLTVTLQTAQQEEMMCRRLGPLSQTKIAITGLSLRPKPLIH
jgi:hypothetical protein